MQKELNDTLTHIVSKNKTISFNEAFVKTCLITKIVPDNQLIKDSKIVFDNIKSTAN